MERQGLGVTHHKTVIAEKPGRVGRGHAVDDFSHTDDAAQVEIQTVRNRTGGSVDHTAYHSIIKWCIGLLCLIVVGAVGWELYSARTTGFPADMRIRNADGRILKVRLEGRTNNHIHLIRRSDGGHFVYPIRKLDVLSRFRVSLYPVDSSFRGNDRLASSAAEAPSTVAVAHLAGLRQARDGLLGKIREKRAKAEATESGVEKRTLESEIEWLSKKLERVERSLVRHGADNPERKELDF